MAQLPLHRLERVVDNFGERRVRAVIHLLFIGDEFVARRDGDIDADPELVSLSDARDSAARWRRHIG